MKIMLCVCLLSLPCAALTPNPETTTMEGSYVWDYGGDGPQPLRAEFSREREGVWQVAFHFKFDGRNHVYKGTAEGRLDSGSLSGEVKNENKRRTFTFKGTCQNGTFSGTHAEIKRGGERRTGSLTLKLQGG